MNVVDLVLDRCTSVERLVLVWWLIYQVGWHRSLSARLPLSQVYAVIEYQLAIRHLWLLVLVANDGTFR